MKISLDWLNDYISLEGYSAQDIAKTLTSLGLEVEGIEESKKVDAKIVLGKVTQCGQHPNADSLKVCKVDVGSDEELNIVCGGINAREGIYVAVAQKGAVLPDGMKIKSSKIRGEPSQGMLCSERELELSEDHDGILEWTEAPAKLGAPVHSFMQKSDSVLELSITPNRADCLSYIGIARDLSAKLERPLKFPEIPQLKSSENSEIKIHIDNEEECGRFCAVMLKGVKALPSPTWLQQRLEASGTRSVNMIVDVTNYVMYEYGQPIHAYDRRFVKEDTFRVRSGESSEYTTLDDSTIKLEHNDILICDAEKIVGLAGIMGGKNSEIKEDTTEVILEVAHFSMSKVRKTARRLALHSEASHRFERGIDIERIPEVLNRVTALILQCMEEAKLDAKVTSQFYDTYKSSSSEKMIALRLDRARSLIGKATLSKETCIKHLENLGFKLEDQKDERMVFKVPSWRSDILREIDLIEEVARLDDYDSIPYEMPRLELAGQKEDPYLEFVQKMKQSFALKGLHEVMTYPYTGSEDYKNLLLSEGHGLWPKVELANALNERQAYLQTTLIPTLLHALQRNRNHGVKGSKLFEVARCYFAQESLEWSEGGKEWKSYLRPSRLFTAKAKKEEGRLIERECLAGILDQPFSGKEWNYPEEASTFFHGKELISSLLGSLGLSRVEFTPCDPSWLPFVHPHAGAWILFAKKRVGWLGELHPQTASAYKLGNESPVVFELDLEAIFAAQEKVSYKIKTPARFPAVVRDLALLVNKDLSYADLEMQATRFPGKKHMKAFRLFDLYEGEQIEASKKSLAVSCTFQSSEKTLTDQEVESELKQLVEHLSKKLGAVQR